MFGTVVMAANFLSDKGVVYPIVIIFNNLCCFSDKMVG